MASSRDLRDRLPHLAREPLEEVLGQQRDVLAAARAAAARGSGSRSGGSRGPRGSAGRAPGPRASGWWRRSRARRPRPPRWRRRGARASPAATRSSLTCIERGISPTSSSISVPRCAVSNRPFLVWWASVNAPFMWPNSSLSSRFSGSAAQLTETKGASRRGERAWTALATSSLPVPLSPLTRIVEARARHRAHEVEHLRHALGHAHDAVEPVLDAELGLEQEVLLLEPLLLERVAHDDLQLVDVEGLDEVVLGAELERRHRRLRRAEGGHDHDHRLRRGRLHVAQDLDAVAVGQLDVGDHHVDRAAVEDGGGLRAALREQDREALLAQHDAEHLAHGGFVVDDQDRFFTRGSGMWARILLAAGRAFNPPRPTPAVPASGDRGAPRSESAAPHASPERPVAHDHGVRPVGHGDGAEEHVGGQHGRRAAVHLRAPARRALASVTTR